MASEGQQIRVPGLKPAVDLSAAANQYRGVEITAANTVNVNGTQGEKCDGVLQNKPTTAQAAEVCVLGLTKAKAGAAIAAGAQVMVDADGDFITRTATNYSVGVAVTAAGADGDIFSLLFLPIGID